MEITLYINSKSPPFTFIVLSPLLHLESSQLAQCICVITIFIITSDSVVHSCNRRRNRSLGFIIIAVVVCGITVLIMEIILISRCARDFDSVLPSKQELRTSWVACGQCMHTLDHVPGHREGRAD
jgi:hypothetical protein